MTLRVIETSRVTSPDPWVEAFKVHLQGEDLSEQTINGYLADLRCFKTWYESLHGPMESWDKVITQDLQAFRQHLTKVLRQKAAGINRRVQALKRFFSWTVSSKRLHANPAEKLKFMRIQARTQPLSLEEHEVHALLRTAGQSHGGQGKRNYALVQTMLQTGLRVGELVALKICDLTIHERSGSVRVVDGKGRREREIPLNATARRSLANHLQVQKNKQPSSYVFEGRNGGPMTVRAVQEVVSGIARRAKVSRVKVTTHTFRHTFATLYLRDHPGQLVELAALLGHESLNTTAVYTKASRESLASDLEGSRLNVFD